VKRGAPKKLSSTGLNPCRPLAGNRDRDRRPCEGSSLASATRPVANAQAASRHSRGAAVRSVGQALACRFRRSAAHPKTRQAEACPTKTGDEALGREYPMPCTDCAKPAWHRALPHKGCAMISRSAGRRSIIILTPLASGHCTPMMGINRSTLSRRTILFLIVLLVAPLAAQSATLEDSARELARKVAAALPARDEVSVEIRNLSSLTHSEISSVQQAFGAELQSLGVHISSNEVATVNVLAAFSENLKGFVWSVEIRQGNFSRSVFLALPKSSENQITPRAKSLTLHAEKFWEGPELILDAAIVGIMDQEKRLVLLVPDGVLIRKFDDASTVTIPLDSSQTKTRSPDGAFLTLYPLISVLLEPNACTVILDPPGVKECHPSSKSQEVPAIAGHGQVAGMRSMCGVGVQTLASGASDYTQADVVQVFESVSGTFIPVTEEFAFPGPVSLHSATTSIDNPTAIVRNLHTGSYEAYRMSISCER
jgi:hypothetical protein